ncbi:hypothetical protein [Anaerococcus sp. AGMB09787]|uniref:hypothetical protein n=1 Tax=Anaerococcus sp. AGMB09787 TaxID=2922869 RepID=UPI001FAF9212|nr:hypothetical protein [Anaerococcus sp. AGMB09787]
MDKNGIGIKVELKDRNIYIGNNSNSVVKIDSYGNVEIRNTDVDRKENKDNMKEYRPYISFDKFV